MNDEEMAHYSAALDEVWRLREALAYEAAVIEHRLGIRAREGTPAMEQIARMRRAARGSKTSHAPISSIAKRDASEAAGVDGLTRWQWENR